MFDSMRLHAELDHIRHTLGNLAATAAGKTMVDELRGAGGATTAALLWQALYADCMRIVYSAVAADGVISDDEVAGLYDMLAAAARCYAAVDPEAYGEFIVVDRRGARAFLERYATDRAPCGRGSPVPWPGLALCRRAAELGNTAALERYERAVTWLMVEACRIGGITDEDPRWRGRVDELDELRSSLAHDAVVVVPAVDLRVQAFLAATGVFTAVQPAHAIFESDPFDVETIHRQARDSFHQMVEAARTSSPIGQMLLVLGDSGSGKTHLLRGFRHHVQEYGRGFVVYAQLQSRTDDYERYLLQYLVDALSQPYARSSGERTGLRELALGMQRLVGQSLQLRMQRLSDDSWDGNGGLSDYVNDLVAELLREGRLKGFDPDLLRVLLYALCPDPCIAASVHKYLLCEDMNPHDRRWIGGVVPKTGIDDPHRMITAIGRLAALAQRALVIMVDQIDLTGFEASSDKVFRHAIDALYHVTSELPSAVAVISCLSDMYDAVRSGLNRPALDRLERSPPIARLKVNCSYPEIEAVVTRRLAWLFAEYGTIHGAEAPVYPIPELLLHKLENRRLRDVLTWCHDYQARCAAAGEVLDDGGTAIAKPALKNELDRELDQIAAAWNDALHSKGIDVPAKSDQILIMVAGAARAVADEAGLTLAEPPRTDRVLRVKLSVGAEAADLVIGVTNKNYHRGAFAAQIERLRGRAGDATAVAIRTLEFPRGEASERVVSQLAKAGGRSVCIDVRALRALAAYQQFQPEFPADRMMAWRRRDRPISTLPAMVQIFDLERLRGGAVADVAGGTPRAANEARPGPITSATQPASESRVAPTFSIPEFVVPIVRGRSEVQVRSARGVTAPVELQRTSSSAGPAAAPAEARFIEIPTPLRFAARPAPPQPGPVVAPASQPAPAIDVAPAEPLDRIPGSRKRKTRATPAPRKPTDPGAESAAPLPTEARTSAAASEAASSSVVSAGSTPPSPVRSAPAGTRPPTTMSSQLRIGVSTGLDAAPRLLEIDSLLRHTGILGSAGGGNTGLALNLVEQALERDVAVILVDHKGDLAGYARPDWWQHAAEPERARRLAEQVDVRLFTPGLRDGRPLALPVVPDLAHVPDHERERIVQGAASALAAMMRFGDGAADTARLAILTQAISVLAARSSSSGLAELVALVARQDDALVARTARSGHYDDAALKRLAQDLEAIQLSDAPLFDPTAEALTVATLTGRRADGKVPLAIVSTRFLGDVPRIQSWVAHLIGCLSSHLTEQSGNRLHTVLVIDEADRFLPGGTARAASKAPLQDLLRRAQTTGLAVVLASQSPADFDYRSRDLISTWFLGRILDRESVDRMKPLLEHLPPIRSKLGRLELGRFVMLQDRGVLDLERAPSLMRTELLSEDELISLAAQANPRGQIAALLPA